MQIQNDRALVRDRNIRNKSCFDDNNLELLDHNKQKINYNFKWNFENYDMLSKLKLIDQSSIDMNSIQKFWNRRAKNEKIDVSTCNFEKDDYLKKLKMDIEEKKIYDYLELKKDYRVLDLGCGWGNWAFKLSDKVKEIYAVDFVKEFIDEGIQISLKRNVRNIRFFVSSVQNYNTYEKFDIVFCSGIMAYLNDIIFEKVLSNICKYAKDESQVLVREPTGIIGRYEVNNKYSEALKDYYSATYRTREEFIDAFEKKGFKLIKDDDMYPEGSPLNKWPETRLRIYSFRRSGLVNGV